MSTDSLSSHDLYEKFRAVDAVTASDGMWGFGNEVVCCFTVGSYEAPSAHTSMHAVDKTKPFETRQSRSMDGGLTWDDPIVMPAESGGRGVSADEHMQTGSGLRCDEAIADGTLVLQDSPGDIPFTHPNFCMMLAKTGLSEGCMSFFYYSVDKCHTWFGPFAIPMLGRTGIAARSDYVVLGPRSCLLMVTANKADGKEGHVMAVKTEDGGKSWRLACFLGPEPEIGFQIMPASVILPSGSILTATRSTGPADLEMVSGATGGGGNTPGRAAWVDLWRSDDEGESFEKVCTPVAPSRSGNPPTLTLLPDGRLVLVVGWRLPPYGIRALVSANEGKTWSDWILLREDAGTGDIGYPRTVLLPSGQLVTSYYYADEAEGPRAERYIGCTVWTPPPGVGGSKI